MQDKLQALKALTAKALDMRGALYVLEWDQETYMPEGGAAARADQLATLAEAVHRLLASDEVGRLLEDLRPLEAELDYDSDEAAIIRVTRREYERRAKVPAELVGEIQRVGALGTEAWKEARAQDDFSIFQPRLEEMVDLKFRWAEYFAPYDNIYDPMIDYYEPGLTYPYISEVFEGLKPQLTELVQAIGERADAVSDAVLHRHYDRAAQLAFSAAVARDLGYDFNRGRLDLSAHPFTISFARDDVRITTRVQEDFLPPCLMGTIHESGHAMYEQGVAPELYRTLLGSVNSMALHESQSRFYENVLGRSRAFWQHYFPRLQAAFPHLADVDEETFYRALNVSAPSLIRVEADEVTYGSHIILRFELENDLFNNRVRVGDLPREWNERMEAYLGIAPPSDANGVLQDIHWSQGLFGYFPDYLLGSIVAVQLWEALKAERPGAEDEVARGEFEGITGWMRQNVHRHGMKFTLPELVERVTGGPLSYEPYMNYLRGKFGEVYGI